MPVEEISHPITGSSEAGTTSHERGMPEGGRLLASAALIGAGILVEPELLGGALLGAGVVYGLPIVGQFLRPTVTTAVQLGYFAVASVGDLLAGARDQVEGIVAAARSDYRRSRGSLIVPEH
ncbi:MAG: hypothetical protein JOZ29_01660 [Deltaproteobacteria bacterium]|nr:hypothetical protein [Deltaproteobacteria bacterium]